MPTLRGLYRHRAVIGDKLIEYAYVVGGEQPKALPQSQYEANGYEPDYDSLPSKEEYDLKHGIE
ncbi:MAG TPA: hypothetical protein VLN73_01435 [Alphaproteobacteria bacterium]|nr:hypothetical protein [Alphaproteobacteria bacterium]